MYKPIARTHVDEDVAICTSLVGSRRVRWYKTLVFTTY